jgi:hypothetical protein
MINAPMVAIAKILPKYPSKFREAPKNIPNKPMIIVKTKAVIALPIIILPLA